MGRIIIVCLIILFANPHGFAQQIDAEPDIAYAHVYAHLGIHLPPDVARNITVQPHLDELKRETCDQVSIVKLADALDDLGYRREASESIYQFVSKCGGPVDALHRATDILLKLSDYPKAVEVADFFVRQAPTSHDAHYLRALAFDGMGDHAKAIQDYSDGIELFVDKKQISSVVFIHMAKAYAALGRYCEAMTPIQTWIAYDQENRDTAAAQKIINDYADKGNCHLDQNTKIVERFALPGPAQVVRVKAEINHIQGTFVIDTGASYIAVQEDFAKRAKLDFADGPLLKLSTANGIVTGHLASADQVKLRQLEAKGVSVVVQAKVPENYGTHIDGLMGMSFLSRFDIHVANGFIELRPKQPR